MEKREVVRRGRKVGVYTYIDSEDFEELEKIAGSPVRISLDVSKVKEALKNKVK